MIITGQKNDSGEMGTYWLDFRLPFPIWYSIVLMLVDKEEPEYLEYVSIPYVDGLVQDCIISIAYILDILQSCTKPSICCRYAVSFEISALPRSSVRLTGCEIARETYTGHRIDCMIISRKEK